jgi:hypothetical protein
MVPNLKTSSREFVSYHSEVDANEAAVTVGFARDPNDEHSLDGLLLQRGKDARDDVPGIEGVYVEIPIQRYAAYGGITEALLRRDSFVLRFDEASTRQMGGLQQILVHFDLPDAEFSSIRDAMRFVFTGCTCFRETV